jgi:predicted nucleic acid-binding Zn finger protein
MLRSKDINKIWELKNGFTQGWVEPDFIKSSLKSFSFSTLCNCLNPIKIKGYSIEIVLTILISLPFKGLGTVKSMFGKYIHCHMEAGKDVFYRLKNNPLIGWRLLLWLFANKFKSITCTKSDINNTAGQLKCMVFDDTLLSKTGRFIEKISRVWDHVSNRCVLGFKLLVMGYWDGTSLIPVDFSLHRELGKNKEKPFGMKKKELKRQFTKKREKGSLSYERAMEADMSKIEIAIKMFARAIAQGFQIDYVLMDSWFTCDAFIDAVLKVKKQTVHLIGMYKIAKTKFTYKGQKYTYSQIRNLLGKAKRCRPLRLYFNEAIVSYNGKEIKLFFSKQGKNGKWKVLVCTNTLLSFVKMIEIYQIRWTIEVFFKESKQLLGLGKCQSNDFDAQIADLTISMIQYTILTLRYRYEKYEAKGGLFSQIKAEELEQKLNQRLWGLFVELLRLIEVLFEDMDQDQLLGKIFQNEQVYEKIAALLNIPDKLCEAA